MKTPLSMTLALALGLLAQPALAGSGFTVSKKVSDQPNVATVRDRGLVNAWGISQGPGSPYWVSDNGTGLSTLYDATTFAKIGLVVTIPSPAAGHSAPTGTVFSGGGGTSFLVSHGGKTGHSIFLFDSEDGAIIGWSPAVDLHRAVMAVNESGKGTVFKGLAINAAGDTIYATDFAHNVVKVYDKNFNAVGSFTDATAPDGYGPFNAQMLNGKIYVTFAKHEPTGHDEAHGPGLGLVDVFDPATGAFTRLVSHGALNAPWGLTIAPSSFGALAGDLLVGNFGDGKINAYDPNTGAWVATLSKANGGPLMIDGLWALAPGSNGTVTFSAGPGGESHGLLGSITPNP